MPKKVVKVEPAKKFPTKWIATGIVVLVVLILVAWFVGTYNAIIAADQNVIKVWADVETNYQRRIDLIPRLVNTTKGYMQFEQGTLTKITELRSQWMATSTEEQRVAVANQLEAALRSIILTYENYPELKSNTVVTGLMDELSGTENRIAVARINYNDAVRNYNNIVKFIPSNVIAGWMGMKERTPFNATTPGAEEAPGVDLNVEVS